MSTLVNLLVAAVINLLTIVSAPQEAYTTSQNEIMQCNNSIEFYNMHYIIKNEQLFQKIN